MTTSSADYKVNIAIETLRVTYNVATLEFLAH